MTAGMRYLLSNGFKIKQQFYFSLNKYLNYFTLKYCFNFTENVESDDRTLIFMLY